MGMDRGPRPLLFQYHSYKNQSVALRHRGNVGGGGGGRGGFRDVKVVPSKQSSVHGSGLTPEVWGKRSELCEIDETD